MYVCMYVHYRYVLQVNVKVWGSLSVYTLKTNDKRGKYD